jgi:hypothetical protein
MAPLALWVNDSMTSVRRDERLAKVTKVFRVALRSRPVVERLDVRPGQRVLEVGSGPGHALKNVGWLGKNPFTRVES